MHVCVGGSVPRITCHINRTCAGLLPECDGTKDEAPPPPGYRLLSSEEVAGLEARGNAAVGQEGWAGVLVQVQVCM